MRETAARPRKPVPVAIRRLATTAPYLPENIGKNALGTAPVALAGRWNALSCPDAAWPLADTTATHPAATRAVRARRLTFWLLPSTSRESMTYDCKSRPA